MSEKIKISELEEIIKNKLKESGLSDNIVKSSIQQIKDKILEKYNSEKPESASNNSQENTPIQQNNASLDVEIPSENNENNEEENPELIEKNVKTDVEQEIKEKELEEKEKNIRIKELELEKKEEELRYKPQIPTPLKEAGKECFFVFNQNEISLGAEALSNHELYLKDNPEMKASMHSIWLNKAITKAELFVVEFKKIGELEFNPFEGTTKLMQFTTDTPIAETSPNTGFDITTTTIDNSVIKTPPSEDDEIDKIIREKIEKMIKSIQIN